MRVAAGVAAAGMGMMKAPAQGAPSRSPSASLTVTAAKLCRKAKAGGRHTLPAGSSSALRLNIAMFLLKSDWDQPEGTQSLCWPNSVCKATPGDAAPLDPHPIKDPTPARRIAKCRCSSHVCMLSPRSACRRRDALQQELC